MEFKAFKLAELLGGQVLGDQQVSVSSLSKIEEGTLGSVSFLSNPKYTPYLYKTKASIVIISKDLLIEQAVSATLILVEDPYLAFTNLLTIYNNSLNDKKGVEEFAVIAKTAKLGVDCYIASFSYIGENVKIGNNTKIYPNCFIGENAILGENVTLMAGVKIYHDSVIGNNCIIHSGSVIGSDGFGFALTADNTYQKIPQIGNVVLCDNVEIGAACTIDRATLGSTVIRNGAKLDNQIQIGHNVEIGQNCVIAAQTGIAGSVKIGENTMIGGQVGIAGHIIIGKNVKIQAQTGVGKNVPDGVELYGSPAIEATQFRKSFVYFRKLPTLVERLDKLEQLISPKNNVR